MTSSPLNQRRKKGSYFVSWGCKLLPVRLSVLSLAFLGGGPSVWGQLQGQGQLTLTPTKWVQNSNTVSSNCPLAWMNVIFPLNATLASLVCPTQLHCLFSNVVSNFKWFEWWAFLLLPGQCNPRVPKIHMALLLLPATAMLQKAWQRSGRAHMILIAA